MEEFFQKNVEVNSVPDFSYHGAVVVFDLDDTIYRETDFVKSGMRRIAEFMATEVGAYDAEAFAAEAYDVMWIAYLDKENFIDKGVAYVRSKGFDMDIDVSLLVNEYRFHKPTLALPEPSRMLLEYLQKKGVKLALITDGRLQTQRNKIMALGLDAYFAPYAIFISEELGVDKHNPLAFRKVMRLWPEAKKFTYIGDNVEKDFIWPMNFGWEGFCLLDPGDNIHKQDEEKLFLLKRNDKFTTVSEIADIIDKIKI
jgi:putative hydrolase of the HAD superfamily